MERRCQSVMDHPVMLWAYMLIGRVSPATPQRRWLGEKITINSEESFFLPPKCYLLTGRRESKISWPGRRRCSPGTALMLHVPRVPSTGFGCRKIYHFERDQEEHLSVTWKISGSSWLNKKSQESSGSPEVLMLPLSW